MDDIEECVDTEMSFVEETTFDAREKNVTPFHSDKMQLSEVHVPEARYENRAGTFMTGIDIFSKEEKLKMEERAKRFGLSDNLKKSLSDREQDLYTSMGIVEENENTKNARLNVIHMRGTEEMSTKDVFKYFEDYAPASIEWINDVSCNVVWLDNLTAARAMLGLSKKIVGLNATTNGHKQLNSEKDPSHEENDTEMENQSVDATETDDTMMDTNGKSESCDIHIKDIKFPLPPGVWRKGVNYGKSKGIFLRFATRADKKQPNAEKMSEYYKKYGNPNFGGIKGILTESHKRMYKQQVRQTKKRGAEDPPDDVKDKKRVKNPWGALSEAWGINDVVENDFTEVNTYKSQPRSVKDRLGSRLQSRESVRSTEGQSEESSNSDSEEDWCKRSKVLRMRMHADDEEKKMHKRRAKLRTQMLATNRTTDLRSRLGRTKKETPFMDAIQVVVTNTGVTKPNFRRAHASEEEEDEEDEKDEQEPEDRVGAEESEEEDGEIVENTEEKEEGERQKSRAESIQEDEKDESSDGSSDVPEREIQGPKGSVIKVVQHKPRVASTVWSRLNSVKSEVNDSFLKERHSTKCRDLRSTLKDGDLRSRIGNHTRARSPLRIEVKNDKYTENDSDTE